MPLSGTHIWNSNISNRLIHTGDKCRRQICPNPCSRSERRPNYLDCLACLSLLGPATCSICSAGIMRRSCRFGFPWAADQSRDGSLDSEKACGMVLHNARRRQSRRDVAKGSPVSGNPPLLEKARPREQPPHGLSSQSESFLNACLI
jgi:hypothetical protein